MSENNSSNSFVWFLAGMGLGALVGVLYAPRSGSETRDVLRARAEEGRDYVRTRAREARGQAADWVDRGREDRPIKRLQRRPEHPRTCNFIGSGGSASESAGFALWKT
jgi:gas vesicle protein